MLKATAEQPAEVADFSFTRILFDVSEGRVLSNETLQVQNDLDFLGGIGRSYPIVADYEVSDPFAPDVPLVVNTGCLTSTAFMTGLRTYFTGYSPLKRTLEGAPMPAWSAMSGRFGSKLVSAGVGDLVLTGTAREPSILIVKQTDDGPELTLESAPEEMVGARSPKKLKYLNGRFNDRENRKFPAHFAVIGPAGENYETVWFACVVGSTQEMVTTEEDKFRFAGRLGMGSVMGSKKILAIVAIAEEDVFLKGDERLKDINREIGRGEQTRGFRNPNNRDGLGGTGKNTRLLDQLGVLPFKNFEPRGENLAHPVHLETMRESNDLILIDKGCFGCQVACHQDFYDISEDGKPENLREQRRNHGPYIGRYEYEPGELAGPNLGVLDPRQNLALARLDDELGFDTISLNVTVGFAMDYNTRNGEKIGGGVQFGDFEGAKKLKEDIAYGREKVLGKGAKAASEALGGTEFAMHCKGVEHSAYIGQTNPGYPFAIAGGHMSMRTFLLYVLDPNCEPGSADYWIDQITNEGWKMIHKDLHGACMFSMATPDQVSDGIHSIFGVPFSSDRLIQATYQMFMLGFALECKQGTTVADYTMADEVFKEGRKGDLPDVNFLTRSLFEEIRDKVYKHLTEEVERMGYGKYVG